ncbi:hypothetical protein [Streptomyces sp. WAC04114]|uniref:hypothetical protein n=1 Tax=Streptomyces sp. WAC04114 TaxID=2867961 RepID=UPI001C8BAD4C|nr:hypothetical protein [Streptomyces sp. WAC04114]MBX9362401.1 hypothetical protein [Streptomyces sp. WAC04114]
MAELRDVGVDVVDVLGTMVDEPGGRRSAVQEATGLPDAATADEFVALRQQPFTGSAVVAARLGAPP